MTLPVIRLRDSLAEADRATLEQSFQSDSSRDDLRSSKFSEALVQAVTVCRQEVDDTLEEAANQLNCLPVKAVASDLGKLTRFLGQRNR
jgi:hypothetical protein